MTTKDVYKVKKRFLSDNGFNYLTQKHHVILEPIKGAPGAVLVQSLENPSLTRRFYGENIDEYLEKIKIPSQRIRLQLEVLDLHSIGYR